MKLFNVLIGIIPIFDGQLLITQRSFEEKFMPGAWGIPCGKIEFGEALEDAVKRELFEETRLVGNIRKMVGYSMFLSEKDENELHNLQINYLVDLVNDSPVVLDKSSASYRWIPLGKYNEFDLDDFTSSSVKQAMSENI